MCPRTRAGGEQNPNLPLTELTLADFQAMFPPAQLQRLKQFLFCGNYGDALVARDTLPICEYLRRENPKLRIKLVTNGSGRDAAFWSALAKLVTTVTFSIDGLYEVNQIYRRRTSWDRIMNSVQAFLAAGGRAEWDYLVFRHNEHQVAEAAALAAKLGFAKFNLKRSQRFLVEGQAVERFPVLKVGGGVAYYLELPSQPDYQNSGFVSLSSLSQRGQSYREYLHATRISCKAVRDEQVYLSGSGHLFPCCWLGRGLPSYRADSRRWICDSTAWPRSSMGRFFSSWSCGAGVPPSRKAGCRRVVACAERSTRTRGSGNREVARPHRDKVRQ